MSDLKTIEVNEAIPKGADFTLKVPLDYDGNQKATFHLKKIDEEVFMAAKAMIDKGKQFDAVRMVIKTLWVGGDSPDTLKDNFVAVNSAATAIIEMITPLNADLKKN